MTTPPKVPIDWAKIITPEAIAYARETQHRAFCRDLIAATPIKRP